VPTEPESQSTRVEVLTEREAAHGWEFEVRVASSADRDEPLRVTLSWADYEYLSHGAASPSRVVEAVVKSLIGADPQRPLPPTFDASTARRWVRDLDSRVRAVL